MTQRPKGKKMGTFVPQGQNDSTIIRSRTKPSHSLTSLLRLLLIGVAKFLVVCLSFVALIVSVRWACCLSFNVLPLFFSVYQSFSEEVTKLVAENHSDYLHATMQIVSSLSLNSVASELLQWWKTVQVCRARY